MFAKTTFVLTAAIALGGVSSSLAMTRNGHAGARAAFAQSGIAPTLPQDGASSDRVFANGKIIGRDPDRNVRFEIWRDGRTRGS